MIALLASVTVAFGQPTGAIKFSDPRPLLCEDDALHPIAGKSYTYEAVGDPSGGTWHFWATRDPNFIETTDGVTSYNSASALGIAIDELIAHSADYNVNTNGDGSIDITWSSALLNGTVYQTTPTFVVAYYVDPTGCTDNIKIWELDPLNGFTVDILSINPETFGVVAYDGDAPEQCPDIVRGATYVSGAMQYNYGTNYIYYEFVAANFSEYWIPYFDLLNLVGTQVATYEYTFATPDTWEATPPTWTTLESGVTQIPIDDTVVNTDEGVSVFVRVTIANNQYENLAGQTLTMVLDGKNAEDIWDVRNDDCSEPVPNTDDQNDTADQVITPRPSVEEGTTSPITPNIEMVPGNEEN